MFGILDMYELIEGRSFVHVELQRVESDDYDYVEVGLLAVCQLAVVRVV